VFSSQTCLEKESFLNVTANQVINLTAAEAVHHLSGCVFHNSTQNKKTWLGCHSVRKFRSARERWWFLAISNCNATKVIVGSCFVCTYAVCRAGRAWLHSQSYNLKLLCSEPCPEGCGAAGINTKSEAAHASTFQAKLCLHASCAPLWHGAKQNPRGPCNCSATYCRQVICLFH
jgi:hypothetical protein